MEMLNYQADTPGVEFPEVEFVAAQQNLIKFGGVMVCLLSSYLFFYLFAPTFFLRQIS